MKDNSELLNTVLNAVRGNNEAVKTLSTALLGGKAEDIKRVVKELAGVDMTDEQARSVASNFSSPEKIAATT